MVSAKAALERFQASSESFLALAEGFPDEGWVIRPPDEEWSASQTVDHVHETNERTLRRLQRGLLGEAPTSTGAAVADENIVESMFYGIPPPPGIAEPVGCFGTPLEGTRAMTATCSAIAGCVHEGGDRLRTFSFVHPVFGDFDGVQWILFLAAHTENHIPQLRRLLPCCRPR